MAKKTKTETFSGIVAILLMIIIAAIMACVVLLPLVLFVGTVIYHYKFTHIKKRLRNQLSDFWLNENEKNEFKIMSVNRHKYVKIVAIAEKEAEAAGICRNNDGRFSTRSNLGKKIRRIYDDHLPLIKEINERLTELQNQPYKNWKSFNSVVSTSFAFRGTLILWLGIFSYYLSLAHKQGVFEFQVADVYSYLKDAFLYVFSEAISFGCLDEMVCPPKGLQVIAYPFAGAIIGFLIYKIIFFKYGLKFSPKPPKVTLENIDLIK